MTDTRRREQRVRVSGTDEWHPSFVVAECEGPKGRVTRGTMVNCCLCSDLEKKGRKTDIGSCVAGGRNRDVSSPPVGPRLHKSVSALADTPIRRSL